MSDINITNIEKLRKLASVAVGQRKAVCDALLKAQKNGQAVTDDVLKITRETIITREQTPEYVTQYYFSEFRKYGIISGGHMRGAGGRRGAVMDVLTAK